jgi:hypothetical protein
VRHGDDQQRDAQRGGDGEVAAHGPLLVGLGPRLRLGAGACVDATIGRRGRQRDLVTGATDRVGERARAGARGFVADGRAARDEVDVRVGTPGVALSARSTRSTQLAQVMPCTGSSQRSASGMSTRG